MILIADQNCWFADPEPLYFCLMIQVCLIKWMRRNNSGTHPDVLFWHPI